MLHKEQRDGREMSQYRQSREDFSGLDYHAGGPCHSIALFIVVDGTHTLLGLSLHGRSTIRAGSNGSARPKRLGWHVGSVGWVAGDGK